MDIGALPRGAMRWVTIGQPSVLSEGLDQLLPGLGGDVEPAILIGEAFGAKDAFLAGPGETLRPVADDMHGQPIGDGMQFLAEIAGRAATGLFAVGHHHHDPRLVLVVEHLGCLLHPRGQGRAAGRRQRIHHRHDGGCGVGRGLEVEADIALLVRARTVSNEPYAAELRGGRQDGAKRGPRLVDPGDRRCDAEAHGPGHRPRRIEYDHGVLVAGRHVGFLGVANREPHRHGGRRK